MSVNSSSSFNSSLPPSPLMISVSLHCFLHNCFVSKVGVFSVTAFAITSVLVLLPLYILVLCLGLRRWRRRRSGMAMSHSDLFTYHMVVIELMSVLGSIVLCCSAHTNVRKMTTVGIQLFTINVCGQMWFHILTCVERYLAVVHPVTYLSLRKPSGIRIRNITVGCVWLLCFALAGSTFAIDQVSAIIMSYCTISFVLIVIFFCSLSVLCVLMRPRPGEKGRNRQRVDQSKLRALYTITVILGVLLIRFGGHMLDTALYNSVGESGKCGLWLSSSWVALPSSLVLPLLFLQRAGKLQCCKNNNKSGQGSD